MHAFFLTPFFLVFSLFSLFSLGAEDKIRLIGLRGSQITTYIEEITALCVTVYREYPYSYEGTLDEYRPYIESYRDSADGLVTLLFDGEQLVGAATGMPLNEMRPHFQKPFLDQNIDCSKLFYHGELVLLEKYRGQGHGRRLYEALEMNASLINKFTTISFCKNEEDPPSKWPPGYQPKDPFWQKMGFSEHPEIYFDCYWMDVTLGEKVAHRLIYWLKPLEG